MRAAGAGPDSRASAMGTRAACALCLMAACAAFAGEGLMTQVPPSWRTLAIDKTPRAPDPKPDLSKPDTAAEIEANKSYLIPALEILTFQFLLNRFNRSAGDSGSSDYDVSWSTIRRNLRSSWVIDRDPFQTNQLGHPYGGGMYHGFARSAGLNYWESLAYTFAGSALWEVAWETTPPSRNDQINTAFGGSFLGESLFRMSSLLLEHGDDVPRVWREVGAAFISPATGFNRLAFGKRFDAIFASRNPAYYSRLQLGFSGTAQNDAGTSTTKLKRSEALADFSMDYGLPGKPGYAYERPFDYFNFVATASSANGFENVMTRGLLFGRDYEAGERYRGVWGLYGSYDYIAPQTYRVSSTALSLGTTGQWWLSNSIALQGTALAGLGYTAVGTTRGVASDQDYHYGTSPQGLLALRFIFGDKASLDLTGREYFVSRASSNRGGKDNIVRVDASLTVRLHKNHAVTLKYLGNRRDADFPDLGDRTQTRGTLGIFYTLLGHDRFGAVDWR